METALGKVAGFVSVESDVAKEESVVKFDPKKTNTEELAKAINENTGYQASVKL